ncbi:hypothetical protein Pmar_PMAR010168 [Perkinsus marinus ATCC 50983]|uniref:Uncharacterized protein n=1 Tax=Perkinsus marinus (strain ATCC 50983 / TXsc) TaxID=423536 RepID=C5K507_PERM5|nr:hypothetical protein Pmar_PMAR010168 [Perkinsus marinus ATCC 50983]EER20429.1 hypothetical protein Pmar_PMAR010168 [Perkinsus marinus ATCC 50983]|eukprot:XP_002788633.1 hypothetical protein Pmar_PMAR010168 [Perkinsus marinus ATCC 50983]
MNASSTDTNVFQSKFGSGFQHRLAAPDYIVGDEGKSDNHILIIITITNLTRRGNHDAEAIWIRYGAVNNTVGVNSIVGPKALTKLTTTDTQP